MVTRSDSVFVLDLSDLVSYHTSRMGNGAHSFKGMKTK